MLGDDNSVFRDEGPVFNDDDSIFKNDAPIFQDQGPKRPFGLTRTQLIILGGMAIFMCVLLVGAAWLLLGSNIGTADAPTLVPTMDPTLLAEQYPSATAVPVLTPTVTPTPTSTPIPRESLIPGGWIKMASGNVEIWLPASYVGGDLLGDRAATVRAINALGSQYVEARNFARDATADYMIYAVDTAPNPYPVLTEMSVSFEPQPVTDLEAYVTMITTAFPVDFIVMETRRFTPPWGTAGIRLTVQAGQAGNQVMHAIYFILSGDTVWWLEYNAHINNFYTVLPNFDNSARTFWVAP